MPREPRTTMHLLGKATERTAFGENLKRARVTLRSCRKSVMPATAIDAAPAKL
jgi:hypothetical protein